MTIPVPPGAAGMLDGLWRFEVVELFHAEAHARVKSVGLSLEE